MPDSRESKEKQYQFMIESVDRLGPVPMSIRASSMYRTDPKLLVFTLSRHKFVAKMFSGYGRVVEMGCGDAFASRLIQAEVLELHAIDFDPVFIEDAKKRLYGEETNNPITLNVHDLLSGPYREGGLFDAAYSLDVIEHIPEASEGRYMTNVCQSLKPGGVFICGSPSLESQPYASQPSREGHVNCKSGRDLQKLMLNYFEHAFLFGMNDEVLHTGFLPMCHYLFVIAVGNRGRKSS
jgi:SAM-dependent methyltransferase